MECAKVLDKKIERIGDTVHTAGFGDYQDVYQDGYDWPRMRLTSNILDRTTDSIPCGTKRPSYGGFVCFDFDSEDGLANSLGDALMKEEEQLIGVGRSDPTTIAFEGSTMQADSGAPLFEKINGEWYVIGILSSGVTEPWVGHVDGAYGDISVFVRVSCAYKWISAVTGLD